MADPLPRICKDCGAAIEWQKGQNGRPPLYCLDCREKRKKNTRLSHAVGPDGAPEAQDQLEPLLKGVELADHLDFNLRFRGLHLSQHRDKWE
jgi:hypothetical protein